MAEDGVGGKPLPPQDDLEKPPEFIEADPKPKGEPTIQVTDEQWKAMFDVVLAIYDYREQEYYHPPTLYEFIF